MAENGEEGQQLPWEDRSGVQVRSSTGEKMQAWTGQGHMKMEKISRK